MHTLLLWLSFHFNKTLTTFKNIFRQTAYRNFFGSKFWQWQSSSFVFLFKPDQIFFLFHNQLGYINSYTSPHFFWTISWLEWKTLFVKQHSDTFLSAKFNDNMSTFFRWQTRSKIPSVSGPTRMRTFALFYAFHSNKIFTRLRKNFLEPAYRGFYRRKIWQRHKYFFRRNTKLNNPSVSESNRMHTLLL